MANTEQALNKAKSALEDIARLYESNRDEATIMQAQLLYDTRCIARTTLSEIEALTAASAEAATPVARECPNCKGYGKRYESHGNGYGEYLACDLCAASYIRDAIQDVCNGGDVDRAVKAASQQIEEHYAAPQDSQPIGQPELLTPMLLLNAALIVEGGEFAATVSAEKRASIAEKLGRCAEQLRAASNSQPVIGAMTDEQRDKWKLVDGDCREGANGLITYHVAAFDEGYKAGLSASGQAVSEKAEAYKQGYELGLKMQRASDENSGADIRKAALDAAIDACKAVEEGQQSLADMHRDEEGYITENGIPYSNKALGANHCIDAIRALSSTPAQQTEGDK